ncbi:YbaB/EbfC family nucleoid-associated protein [Mycobacteroides salmoniphilum]|uniref:YbaB/EbfC family nucleoid-associated protein n=1 Tax=Mycobacteroides salmoniphilum TaxID=404941 RepID=UPI0009939286|nr:YbaB/EbfC family nucleoid-associated protein [Mycobacteroides salmoniphilum]
MFDGLFQDSDDVDLETIMSDMDKALGAIAESAQRMAIETADARSKDDLVRVWVNAQGIVVKVEVDDEVFAGATSTQVADSMLEATQAAAAKMNDKSKVFQADILKQTSALGAGIPGVGTMGTIDDFAKLQPTVPLSPPNSRERQAMAQQLDDGDGSGDPEPPMTVFHHR